MVQKIAVPLKYLSNFWRSLEMSLINCKVELSLKFNTNCILSSKYGNSVFEITDTKLYVPIVTLSAEDNVKLSKLLGEGFKRSIYWNKHEIISSKTYANVDIRKLLDSNYEGVKRLFVLAYDNANVITTNSRKRYILPRIKIKNDNTEIDGRNFYDQPINGSINQYDG